MHYEGVENRAIFVSAGRMLVLLQDGPGVLVRSPKEVNFTRVGDFCQKKSWHLSADASRCSLKEMQKNNLARGQRSNQQGVIFSLSVFCFTVPKGHKSSVQPATTLNNQMWNFVGMKRPCHSQALKLN